MKVKVAGGEIAGSAGGSLTRAPPSGLRRLEAEIIGTRSSDVHTPYTRPGTAHSIAEPATSKSSG